MKPLFRYSSSHNLSVAGTYGPPQMEQVYAHSVGGGAGGRGTKISTATHGTRLGSGYDNQTLSSKFPGIGNEKLYLQQLNERLARYLEKVKTLEESNNTLKVKIREATERKAPSERRDHSKYSAIIAELRGKIFDMYKCNAQFEITLDNARVAAEDFRGKLELESFLRHSVKADDARLRKNLDATNVVCLQLESDIESMREELILLKKAHEADVAEWRAQTTQAGVHVDVDAPRGQDLSRVLEEMRDRYEKMIEKNKEEAEAWHETRVKKVQVQVTENSTALKEATGVASVSKRTLQDLEIELQSECTRNASLENHLHDIQTRYSGELREYENCIQRLKEQLSEMELSTRSRRLSAEKLEAEIGEYKRLLEGSGTSRQEEAAQSRKIQTKVVTITQTLVDGEVVSENQEEESSERVGS